MKIITIHQKNEWMSYLYRAFEYDFYHSWTYHSINKEGEAILVVYDEGIDFIAFPLILKKIEGTQLNDMGSVYGYSGPLASKKMTHLDSNFVDRYIKAFRHFLNEHKVVSVFSRLHPLLDQSVLLDKLGGVHKNGHVAAIDLTVSVEQQHKNYHPSVFRKIMHLKRDGYYARIAGTDEDIEVFHDIYTQNMVRVSASDCYKFTVPYFRTLLRALEFDAKLVLVCNRDHVPVSGMIFVLTNGIAAAHLLGTKTDFVAQSPAKLLINEISMIARSKNMAYFNLGSGVGFKEDSLYQWKSRFSKCKFEFNTWRYIANREAYFDIVKKNGQNPLSEVDFFPLYRCPATQTQVAR